MSHQVRLIEYFKLKSLVELCYCFLAIQDAPLLVILSIMPKGWEKKCQPKLKTTGETSY